LRTKALEKKIVGNKEEIEKIPVELIDPISNLKACPAVDFSIGKIMNYTPSEFNQVWKIKDLIKVHKIEKNSFAGLIGY
jgi:hypothetical protein